MWDRPDPDLGRTYGDVLIEYVMKTDVAAQFAEVHREVGGPHEVTEHVVEGAILLDWPVHIELGPGAIDR
jgi:hypothetical protein